MKQIIKMLKDRGKIDALKMTEKIVTVPKDIPEERKSKLIDEGRLICIKYSIAEDMTLCAAFAEACFELGQKELVKELREVMK